MAGFNARTGLEELEEYAVEHVAADIIVNANESNYNLPRPIEQAVAAKLAGFPFNRYPPMQAETLRGLIAEDLALDADNIRIGNGSSELLQMACYAFGGNGRKIAFPYPSFSMYGVYTKLADSIAAPYPLTLTGYVDADKVILRENITLAGGYTQVGNLTKSQNGTATFSTKGKSVMDALTEIFSKRLQPSITAQPSIGTFTLTGAGAVEAGTKVASAAYSAASLNAGSYQYGPATGVTATNWKVERITNAATAQVVSVAAASLTAGSDNNGGAGFIIGDAGGDNAVSSLKYRVTVTHGAGVTAKDNLGAASSPVVAIAAGTKTKDTGAYTPFRTVFYGTSTGKPALDSAAIRALGKTGKAYAAGTLTLNVPAGTQRVVIACIATAKGVTKVINETAMNADVTSTFVKSTVPVEGANGYTAKDYNVWVFEPAVAYGNAAVLKVTLG